MAYSDKKEHRGKAYSGMRVGGVHRWNYPDGIWKERKLTPSRWEISFTSHKQRRAKAPQGSGAETGSGYHWYILAHQWARKLDANTYATFMEGSKHLIAFRKPAWSGWNTQFRNQRSASQRVLKVLEEELKAQREVAAAEEPWDLPMFARLGRPSAKEEQAREVLTALAPEAPEVLA